MISRTQIDKAGDILRLAKVNSPEYKKALLVAEEWRKTHAYPLRTFKSNLDKRLKKYPKSISAQRLKRMPTILDKLQNRESKMRLSAMQDIGGIRAILKTTNEAEQLALEYKNAKRFTHILKESQCRNYIKNPKEDGYRGIHLIYEYRNNLSRAKQAQESKGMLIEIQIRSQLQHIWATAVETVGLMTGKSIKTKRGDKEWSEFFKYVSSMFAIIEKRNALLEHKHKTEREIYYETTKIIHEKKIMDKLKGYSKGLQVIDDSPTKNYYYHLLKLNTNEKKIVITGFDENEHEEALTEYAKIEADQTEFIDSVLVSTKQRKELIEAYPNYYLDLDKFTRILNEILALNEQP